MGLFSKKELTKHDLMEQAGKFARKGKLDKAIDEYRALLLKYPDDYNIHLKVAPLYAKSNLDKKSLTSFQLAFNGFHKAGFEQKALGVLNSATTSLPKSLSVWDVLSKFHLSKGRKHDAILVLIKGRKKFHKKDDPSIPIKLLKKAFDIEPWNFDVTFDLGKLYMEQHKYSDALLYFTGLEKKVTKKNFRKVRWQLYKIHGGFNNFWKWFRVLIKIEKSLKDIEEERIEEVLMVEETPIEETPTEKEEKNEGEKNE